MKLYFAPGACSLAVHIVAEEAGIQLTLDEVGRSTRETSSGSDFSSINPKGYVPALELDDGQLLTEGPTILQYLAEQHPDSALLPKGGSLARYRVLEMLGYANSEIHKAYGPLFRPSTPPDQRAASEASLRKRYPLIDRQLDRGPYLFGDSFTIADAYVFVLTSWAPMLNVDLSEFSHLTAFQTKVAARPAVKAAMRAEGLSA